MTTKNHFDLHNAILYHAMKWSVTIPLTILGNFTDLLMLGLPKKVIDVTPAMTSGLFYRDSTNSKEQDWYRDFTLTNKGFAGLLRCISSYALEIPLNILAPAAAAILTAFTVLIANTIGVPLVAIAEFASNNMLG